MERYDFSVSRGGTFTKVLRIKEDGAVKDLTGYTAKSQVRENPDGGMLICEMTTAIDAGNGIITLTIPAATSAEIKSGAYCWDLKLTDAGGLVAYYIGGKFMIVPTVTE